jgi:pimeloyl-ACP methyl ester carboxylesterase
MRSAAFERPDEVTVPVTLAWGELDRLLRPPRPERMPPQTRYLVLEGCGHTPTWDDPVLVTRVLLEASAGPATPS